MNIKEETTISLEHNFYRYVKQKCFKKAIVIASKYKIKGVLVTTRTLKVKYGLNKLEISKMQFVEVDNPHYKCAASMKLYLEAQAQFVVNKAKRYSETL